MNIVSCYENWRRGGVIPKAVEPLVDEDGRPCFIIEKVVSRRIVGNRRDYLIKWQGYDTCENTYISRQDVASGGALQLMKDYDAAAMSVVGGGEEVKKKKFLFLFLFLFPFFMSGA